MTDHLPGHTSTKIGCPFVVAELGRYATKNTKKSHMKQLILLVTVILYTATTWAQDSLIQEGKYLFITPTKDGASVVKCEITNGKERVYFKFEPNLKYPEFAMKPLQIYMKGNEFMFTSGPGDFVHPQAFDKAGLNVTTYCGKVENGEIKGVSTFSGCSLVTETSVFILYKE